MNGVRLRLWLVFFLPLSLLLSACSTTPAVNRVTLQPTAGLSRDGILQYRLPVGWFDVTADSQAVGHTIWMFKNDYRASMTVDEVHTDPAARDLLERRDLLQLARLLLPLVQSEKRAVVEEPPGLSLFRGHSFCVCELTTKDNDTLRYVLFSAGPRLYAATLLFSGGAEGWSKADARGVQQTLLESLEW
jgi:hypothetical protein